MNTLEISYPNYIKKRLLTRLASDGLIINSKRVSNKGQLSLITDVSQIEDIDEKFVFMFEQEYKYEYLETIEDFEFSKEYRHTVYFEIENLDINKINNLHLDNEVNLYQKGSRVYDHVDVRASKPTLKQSNEDLLIKFNYLLHSKGEGEIDRVSIKYVVLAKINIKENILELRLDKVGFDFRNNREFYASIIDRIKNRLKEMLGIEIKNIDFKAVIHYIKSEKDDVLIYAMKMHRNGTIAYLDALSNDELVIPILGELKAFISTNSQLINSNDKTQEIGYRLEKFIEGIENKSDLPSVKMIWPKKGIRLGVEHTYKDRNYSFFMFYDELGDSRERMDYVREYLINSYKELNRQT